VSWIIRLEGADPVSSDDFTLDDLIRIEKATDTPWAVLNPFKSGPVAREFYRIALKVTGGDPKEADSATLGRMKTMFDWEPDEPFPATQGGGSDDVDPLPLKVQSSSPGARTGTTGSRQKRAASA
jgi:hypothetical protein